MKLWLAVLPLALLAHSSVQAEEPAPKVDDRLATAFADRINRCYEAEAGKPMSDADQQLVHKYRHDLVLELGASLKSTSCRADKPADKTCVKELAELSCDSLAAPIKQKGFDRHLTAEGRKLLNRYAMLLSRRHLECKQKGALGEAAQVRLEYRATKHAHQAAMLITVGTCRLHMQAEAACKARVEALDCEVVQQLQRDAKLIHYCTELLECQDVALEE